MFRNINLRGKHLVEVGVLKTSDLDGWLSRGKNPKWKIVAVGLPAYCTLHTLLESARANSAGLLLSKYFLDVQYSTMDLLYYVQEKKCSISRNLQQYA